MRAADRKSFLSPWNRPDRASQRRLAPIGSRWPLWSARCSRLGGCSVGPDFTRPPATVAPAWHGRPATRASARRRRPTRCGGRASMIPRSTAWSSSPAAEPAAADCRAAHRRGARADGGRDRAAVPADAGWPFASATAIGLSKNAVNLASAAASRSTSANFAVGFDAAWELDFWGKYRRGVEAEAANMLASVADYYAALVSLTAEVARTYVAIRTDEVLIEQARQNAKLQEEALKIAQARFQNGATSELDAGPGQHAAGEHARDDLRSSQGRCSRRATRWHAAWADRPAPSTALLAGPQDDPPGAREGGGGRARRDVAAPARHSQRGAGGGRAVRAHRRRQGPALPELLAVRHHRPAELDGGGRRRRNLFSSSSCLLLRRARRSTWPFFNYGRLDEHRARRGRALPAAAGQLPRHRAEGVAGGRGRAGRVRERRRRRRASRRRRWRPRSDRSRSRSRSTARGRPTTSACWTRSGSCCSSRTTWRSRSSSVATNVIALYKALGGGWEVRRALAAGARQTQQEMKARTNWGDMLSQPATVTGEQSRAAPGGATEGIQAWPRRCRSKKRWLKWGGLAAVVVIAAFIGFATGRRSRTRCPTGSCRATAASRPSSSTSPPRSRCA